MTLSTDPVTVPKAGETWTSTSGPGIAAVVVWADSKTVVFDVDSHEAQVHRCHRTLEGFVGNYELVVPDVIEFSNLFSGLPYGDESHTLWLGEPVGSLEVAQRDARGSKRWLGIVEVNVTKGTAMFHPAKSILAATS